MQVHFVIPHKDLWTPHENIWKGVENWYIVKFYDADETMMQMRADFDIEDVEKAESIVKSYWKSAEIIEYNGEWILRTVNPHGK